MSAPTPPKSSRLLIDENPLQVLPSLATAIGLNESIILQQVQYWITGSKVHERDGHLWIYNSIPQWKENFPWWSESTIKRALNNLRESGLLIVANFNAAAFDKTLWYRIDYEALAQVENLKRVNRRSGQNDPTSGSRCPDEKAILNRPIPETTTEITKPETTTATTNQPVVSPSRARAEPAPPQNGWLVLQSKPTASESLFVSETASQKENSKSNPSVNSPPIAANGEPKSLSAAPPGLTDAQALAYAVLSDPELAATAHSPSEHAAKVKRWVDGAKTDAAAIRLINHAAVVWHDCRRGVVRGVAVLDSRLKCEPNPWPPEFLDSDFYRRHFPLTKAEADVRGRAIAFTGKAPPHPLGELADALPAPVWTDNT
jgi:hypothetical protein